MPAEFKRAFPMYLVSIHAPRCRGAMREFKNKTIPDGEFQSTPPVAGGRCVLVDGLYRDPYAVSIHAPRCRGAMRLVRTPLPVRLPRFNPRPPLPGGDASQMEAAGRSKACFNPRPPLPGGDATGNS